jgi:hypothetical protein
MHFHYPSFLLGILLGIVFLCLMIYLAFRLSISVDDELFRIQKRVDDFPMEAISEEAPA